MYIHAPRPHKPQRRRVHRILMTSVDIISVIVDARFADQPWMSCELDSIPQWSMKAYGKRHPSILSISVSIFILFAFVFILMNLTRRERAIIPRIVDFRAFSRRSSGC